MSDSRFEVRPYTIDWFEILVHIVDDFIVGASLRVTGEQRLLAPGINAWNEGIGNYSFGEDANASGS